MIFTGPACGHITCEMNDLQAWVQGGHLIENRAGTVRAAMIDGDNREVRIRLRQHGRHTRADSRRFIFCGDDDADTRGRIGQRTAQQRIAAHPPLLDGNERESPRPGKWADGAVNAEDNGFNKVRGHAGIQSGICGLRVGESYGFFTITRRPSSFRRPCW